MAKDRIEANDIVDVKGVLDGLNKIELGLKDVLKQQQEILKTSKKGVFNVEQLEKANVALTKSKSAREGLNKVEQERIRLEQKLKTLNSDSIQQNEELKVLISEQSKTNKELAKEKLGLISTYQKESKRLNELRKRYKDLILSNKGATKESKALLKEIKRLDKELKDVDASAGQFQRNVGNYPEIFGKAAKSIAGIGAAVLAAKGAFDGVKGSLEATEEGSEDLRKVSAGLSAVWKQAKNVAAGFALDVVDVGKALTDSGKEGNSFIKIMGMLNFNRTRENFDGIIDKTKDLIDSEVEAVSRTIEFEKAVRGLNKELAILDGEIARQLVIAGDSTRSFKQIENALLSAQAKQVERSKIALQIAEEELKIIQIKLQEQEKLGLNTLELKDQEAEATLRVIEAENQLKVELLENEKELRQIKQDRLERDLDILIDGFDNQKTINEQIIANEKETLKRRSDLLQQTIELSNKSFREQKEVLEELSKAGVDIDELLKLDATELQKQIRLLEQSEIIEGRTLEVVRERRIVLQDLEVAQQELNDALGEGLDIQEDIATQERTLEANSLEALELFESEREELQKESLRRRIAASKEGSLERLKLEQELNDILLEEQRRSLEKQKELDEKALEEEKKRKEERIKDIKEITSLTFDELNKINEKRKKDLDDEISDREKSIEVQQSLAERGLENQLAFEKQKLAEVELEKREIEKREARQKEAQKLAEIYLEAYLAELNQPDANPQLAASKALANTLLAKGIAKGLASFKEGTEDTGKAGNPLDKDGGRLAVLHDNERVLTKEQNALVGGLSNEQLANLAYDFRVGNLTKEQKRESVLNAQILMSLNQIKKTIYAKPVHQFDVDGLGNIIEKVYKKGATTKIHHKRRSRL